MASYIFLCLCIIPMLATILKRAVDSFSGLAGILDDERDFVDPSSVADEVPGSRFSQFFQRSNQPKLEERRSSIQVCLDRLSRASPVCLSVLVILNLISNLFVQLNSVTHL